MSKTQEILYIKKKKNQLQPVVGIQQIIVIEFETDLQINQDFIYTYLAQMLGAPGDPSLKNRYSLRRIRLCPQVFNAEKNSHGISADRVLLNMLGKAFLLSSDLPLGPSSRACDSQRGAPSRTLCLPVLESRESGLEGRLTVSSSSFPKRKLFLILVAVETAYINIISTSLTTSSFSFF